MSIDHDSRLSTAIAPDPGANAERTSADPRAELVARIRASRHFERSPRLRSLLDYVCRRVIQESAPEISEAEIALHVFDRTHDFDATQDTIVRVQASQLRKKLAQYFAEEGSAEPLGLEIHKGGYLPRFHPREVAPERQADGPRDEPRRQRRLISILAFAVLALAVLCAWLAAERFAPSPALAVQTRPSLDALWSQLLRADQPTNIVVADSSLALVQYLLGKPPVSVSAYTDRSYLKELEGVPPDVRRTLEALIKRQYTSLADAEMAARIMRLAGQGAVDVSVAYARDYHLRRFRRANVILLGNQYSTPWVEVFERHLNFRLVHQDRDKMVLHNLQPLPGEAADYVTVRRPEAEESYGVVAFLPNLDDTGSVLLLAGTDMEGTEAAGTFVTTEEMLAGLRSKLTPSGAGRLPRFEALLRVRKAAGAVRETTLVAHRLIGPGPGPEDRGRTGANGPR